MDRVAKVGGDALELDFTGLFGDPPENQPTRTGYTGILGEGEYKTTAEPETPPKPTETACRAGDALEVYRAYQENIKASAQLQTAILKGIKAGESLYSLFLQAAKAISLMTKDELFYSQIEADTVAVYGAGLLQKDPLQKDLEDARKRLERLQEAEGREQDPDTKQRIQAAITAHKRKVTELESLL